MSSDATCRTRLNDCLDAPRFERLANAHLFPGLYAVGVVLMKEAIALDDCIGEGYEIVELPFASCPTGYFSHTLFTGVMSEGFNRKADEYDVDFEYAIPVYYDLGPPVGTLVRAELTSKQ